MNDKQKKHLDKSFNKDAVSQMNESEFVKTYKGKLALQIDIKEAMKYLGVKKGSVSSTAKAYSKPDNDK